ncbi:hypothetical protein WJX77_010320 [Trebouxia sp. C0004]
MAYSWKTGVSTAAAQAHGPTCIPIVAPIINPDDSSAEYTLTMKEAATLAYLWNVSLFPSEAARPTVFDLLFKSVRLEEAPMHTQAMKDNVVTEILHAAKTGRWRPGYVLTKNLRSSFHVKGREGLRAIRKVLKVVLGKESLRLKFDDHLLLTSDCSQAEQKEIEISFQSPPGTSCKGLRLLHWLTAGTPKSSQKTADKSYSKHRTEIAIQQWILHKPPTLSLRLRSCFVLLRALDGGLVA